MQDLAIVCLLINVFWAALSLFFEIENRNLRKLVNKLHEQNLELERVNNIVHDEVFDLNLDQKRQHLEKCLKIN